MADGERLTKLVSICGPCVKPMLDAGYKKVDIVQDGKRCFRCATKVPFWYWFFV